MLRIGKGIRLDGYENLVTGLGRAGFDKRVSTIAVHAPLREADAEDLYHSEDIARRVVDKLPEEALREGIVWTGTDRDLATDLQAYWERLQVLPRAELGTKWGRLYGGAGAFLSVDDGSGSLEEPLDLTRIRTIRAITILSRWELYVQGVRDVIRDVRNPDYGYPRVYTLVARRGAQAPEPNERTGRLKPEEIRDGVRIHHTRIVRFDGAPLAPRARARNGYWDDSVLTAKQDKIRDYEVSHGYAAAAVHDFNVAVLLIKNLKALLSAKGGEAQVQTRLELIAYAKSLLGVIPLDADGESFENKARNTTGLPEILEKLKARLGASTEYPNTVLFNEGPKDGLGSEGKSQQKGFYDTVAGFQTSYLCPRLDRLLQVTLSAKDGPTNGKIPEDLDYDFPELFQPTTKEVAETRKLYAEVDNLLADLGVDPRKLLEKRYGGDEFATEIKLEQGDIGEPPAPPPAPGFPGNETPGPMTKPEEDKAVEEAEAVTDVLLDAVDGKPTRAIQTVLVSTKAYPDLEEAKKVLARFGGTYKKHDAGDGFWRFRQRDPSEFSDKGYRTFSPNPSVRIVYGHLKA